MSGTHDQNSQEDRITIIVPSFCKIAMEIHRQKMWDKGYRLESNVKQHTFLEGDGKQTKTLFSGEQMYAATFVKN
jgi:hypothetical protein